MITTWYEVEQKTKRGWANIYPGEQFETEKAAAGWIIEVSHRHPTNTVWRIVEVNRDWSMWGTVDVFAKAYPPNKPINATEQAPQSAQDTH